MQLSPTPGAFSCAGRSPGLASSYWDAFPSPLRGTVAFCPFVRFTVTGIAQKSHLHSHGIAQSNTGAVLRTNTRYSFQNTQAPLSGGMITPFDWQIALLLWYSGVAAPEGLPAVATAMPEPAAHCWAAPQCFLSQRDFPANRSAAAPGEGQSVARPEPAGNEKRPCDRVCGSGPSRSLQQSAGGRPRRRGRRFAREPV